MPPTPTPQPNPIEEDPDGSWSVSHYHVDGQGGPTVSRTDGAVVSWQTHQGVSAITERKVNSLLPSFPLHVHSSTFLGGGEEVGRMGDTYGCLGESQQL